MCTIFAQPGGYQKLATLRSFSPQASTSNYGETTGESGWWSGNRKVGRSIPSLKIEAGSELFLCCPEHAAGSIDPHWWNSVENIQRCLAVLADTFGKKDPANAAVYKSNAAAWSRHP